NVTNNSLGYARLSTVLPSGVDNAQGTIVLNSQNVALTNAEGTNEGQDPGFKYYDVTGALQDGTNELAVTSDGYMNLAAAILELTYEAPPAGVSFSANLTSGESTLTVQFTDLSYGATSWQWDFNNDGTIDSTEKNPVHTYTNAGTYTVNLTATNAYGSTSMVKTGYITVTGGSGGNTGPVVSFSADITSGTFPLTVRFTDGSTGDVTAWAWDFQNDGVVDSTVQNPAYNYTNAGTYSVNLTATNAEGTNSTVKSGYITVSIVSAASLPLTTEQTGTVSGDLYVGSFQPVPFGNQPQTGVTSRDFDQPFTIPAFTNIQWAKVYVNVYSGTGSGDWPTWTTTSLDANGDGTYETVLGIENMTTGTAYSTDGKVYRINDHTNRVYSDYETSYDVTNLITSTQPAVHVKNQKIGTGSYDGRLKAVTLVVAYNDGDSDTVKYWVNHGHDWFKTGSSSTTFGTAGIPTGFTGATLSNVALSSADSTYTFNSVSQAGANPVAPINYYENHTWSVTGAVNPAADSVFQYALGSGSSFKTTLAALAVRYPGSAPAPVADFTATPVFGIAPLTVSFTDASTNTPTAWNWESRASGTSDSWTSFATTRNPVTNFSAGAYDIRLTVTNTSGNNTVTKTQYLSVSAGPKRLATVRNGTVSGDLYVGAFQPVPWSNQSPSFSNATFTQAYTIPAHTDIQWARLYAVVNAANTQAIPGLATVTFDSNGDGTYETALGNETLSTSSTFTSEVYPVNDHVNKQYADYMIWYNVTPYINANTVHASIFVSDVNFGGRLKELTLVVAYNDGDSDQVKYWVNEGHDYQSDTSTAITTSFATSSLGAGWTSATLRNVGLSSEDVLYTFNSNTLTGQGIMLPYFETNTWDVRSFLTAGSDSSFVYMHNTSSSFKTTLAALAVRYPGSAPATLSATSVSGIGKNQNGTIGIYLNNSFSPKAGSLTAKLYYNESILTAQSMEIMADGVAPINLSSPITIAIATASGIPNGNAWLANVTFSSRQDTEVTSALGLALITLTDTSIPPQDLRGMTRIQNGTFTTGGNIQVQVVGADGNPVIADRIALEGGAGPISVASQSSQRFSAVPAGTYQLIVTKAGHIGVNTTISYTAGTVRDLTATMVSHAYQPTVILAENGVSLAGMTHTAPEQLNALRNETDQYNLTLNGGGVISVALEYPMRFQLNQPQVTSALPVGSEIRNGTFLWTNPSYTTTNATLVVTAVPAGGQSPLEFLLTGGKLGDVYYTGQITSTDSLYILHYIVGDLKSLPTYDYADITRDGKITSTDALYILHYIVGNVNEYYQKV
ncbi:MAG: DUF3344 domain-containing protein, partial [Methanoregula sp.]